MSRHSRLPKLAGAAFTLAAMGLVAWSRPMEPARIAGTVAFKYAEQHPLPVPDAEGHVLMVGRVEGRNRSTGAVSYMDQGQVTNLEFADLTQGNGVHQGYITMSQGADTVVSRWSGKVTTTLSSNKTPSTTFGGTWTKVKGTGRYQDVDGNGSYKGRFTSKTEYTVDWSGQLSGGRLAEK